jgi:hypothetical protein
LAVPFWHHGRYFEIKTNGTRQGPNARFEKFTLLPQANFELSFRFSCKKGLLLALAENSGAIPAMSGSHMLL